MGAQCVMPCTLPKSFQGVIGLTAVLLLPAVLAMLPILAALEMIMAMSIFFHVTWKAMPKQGIVCWQ
ncbi:hypothetical protein PZ78_07985 [Vreelandella venusta]|nr:hypothetical protein PZ78_07985 [Halomonas hydrothermalis]